MRGWQIHRLERSLGSHAARWDLLNEREFGAHPLLRALVVEQLLASFGTGQEVLCEHLVQGQTRAMCILTPSGRLGWASFLPSQTQIGLNLLHHAQDLESLFDVLPHKVLQLDLLCQDPLLTNSEGMQEPRTHRLNHARTAWIDVTGSWDDYLGTRSKNLRANLRRYQHRLESEGIASHFVCHTEPEAVAAAVRRYAEMEGRGWKAEGGTALASSPEQFGFYESLLTAAAASGTAQVYELYLNGQLAGSRLTVFSRRTLVILKTAYEESLARLAPGRLHLVHLLQTEFAAQRFDRIELYTNASPETATWCTGTRWIRHLSLLRHPGLSLLIDGVAGLRQRWAGLRRVEGEGLVVKRVDRIDDLPTAALELLDAQSDQGSCLGTAWLRNLEATVFPSPKQTRYFWLQDEDRVLAVLPLHVSRRTGQVQLQGLSNYYTSLYAPGLHTELRPTQLAVLVEQVLRGIPGVASLRLEPMAGESVAATQLASALRLLKLPTFHFFCFNNWTLDRPLQWEPYLATRSGALRSTLKRKGARLQAAGGRLVVISRPEDLAQGLQDYLKVYAKSWKPAEPYPDFIPGLMRTFADRGELRLGLAYLGDQPIAAQLWLIHKGRAEIHKLAYDEAQAAFSPGSLLTAHLLRHVMEQDQVKVVDFLTGDDNFKAEWMNSRQSRWGVLAYNPRNLRGLLGLAWEWLGMVTRRWRRKTHTVLPGHDRRQFNDSAVWPPLPQPSLTESGLTSFHPILSLRRP